MNFLLYLTKQNKSKSTIQIHNHSKTPEKLLIFKILILLLLLQIIRFKCSVTIRFTLLTARVKHLVMLQSLPHNDISKSIF